LQQQKRQRTRGPSISASQRDFELIMRFRDSEIVQRIEDFLHEDDMREQSLKKKIFVEPLPLNRRLAHALAAAHGFESTSINVNANQRGVQISVVPGMHGTCTSKGSASNCSVMADIRAKSGSA